MLVDPDIVEPHNLRRQNFYPADLGKFKARVLADRLANLYGLKVGYCIVPFEADLLQEPTAVGGEYSFYFSVLIGCVDNAAARVQIHKAVAAHPSGPCWWFDAGNGEDFGQVLVGNVTSPQLLIASFDNENHTVSKLPAPSLQNPNLLIPPARTEVQALDCAEAVEEDLQSPVINQAMSTVVLNMVSHFIKGDLDWMATYLDLSASTMRTVPADPKSVARATGMPADLLIDTPKNRRHIYA
jgi:PRTRC genetic system ThiF family protein